MLSFYKIKIIFDNNIIDMKKLLKNIKNVYLLIMKKKIKIRKIKYKIKKIIIRKKDIAIKKNCCLNLHTF